MSTQSPWRSVKNDPPKASDGPIVVGRWNSLGNWDEWVSYAGTAEVPVTHWRSIKCDPPPREQTQRERDEAAFSEWKKGIDWGTFNECWHDALKWEREAVENELRIRLIDEGYDPEGEAVGVIERFFRARREGGSK